MLLGTHFPKVNITLRYNILHYLRKKLPNLANIFGTITQNINAIIRRTPSKSRQNTKNTKNMSNTTTAHMALILTKKHSQNTILYTIVYFTMRRIIIYIVVIMNCHFTIVTGTIMSRNIISSDAGMAKISKTVSNTEYGE